MEDEWRPPASEVRVVIGWLGRSSLSQERVGRLMPKSRRCSNMLVWVCESLASPTGGQVRGSRA